MAACPCASWPTAWARRTSCSRARSKILATVDKPLAARSPQRQRDAHDPEEAAQGREVHRDRDGQRAARKGAIQEHAHPGGEEVNRCDPFRLPGSRRARDRRGSRRRLRQRRRLPGQAGLDAPRAPEEGGQERQDGLDLPDRRPRARSEAHQARPQERRAADDQLAARQGQRQRQGARATGSARSRRASSTTTCKALALQIKALPHGAIVRPMPDPNTPWYAWSGTVNGNRPGDYVRAWKHVRKVLTQDRGQEGQAALERVRAQRARRPRRTRSRCTSRAPSRSTSSAPTPTTSATPRASPGRPRPTCSCRPTARIQKLAAKKPFWISETGSTARGGDEGAWIGALGQLGKTMPKLAGVVWYDVRDSTGDFRVPRKGAAAAAFKAFVRSACK